MRRTTAMTYEQVREALLGLSEGELAAIAAAIGVDYAALGGLGQFGKTRELIAAARGRRRMDALADLLAPPAAPEPAPEAGDSAEVAAVAAKAPPAEDVVEPTDVLDARAEEDVAAEAGPVEAALAPEPVPAWAAPAEAGQHEPEAPRWVGAPAVEAASAGPPGEARSARWLPLIIVVLVVASIGMIMLRRTGEISTGAEIPAPSTPANEPAVQMTATRTGVSVVAVTTPGPAPDSAVQPRPSPGVVIAVSATAAPERPVSTAAVALIGTPLPTSTPAPAPTRAAAQLDAAADSPAAAINAVNDQVIAYLQGRATVQDLGQYWQGSALPGVRDFLETKVPASLGVGGRDRTSIRATMRYLGEPKVTQDAGGATLAVREFWRYTTPVTNRTACETRDYVYRLVKTAERYKVDEFRGTFIDAKCVE